VPAVASALLASLLDDPVEPDALVDVARTPVSAHYLTGRADVPVLCVCTPAAVRLPNALVTLVVPHGPLTIRGGGLESGGTRWQVTRWWQPPRPRGLTRPTGLTVPSGLPVVERIDPDSMLGRGPGLTPTGDDVLAGALVAARAVHDPRLPDWRRSTLAALRRRRTTAVSEGLLRHALDGWATPELAAFLTGVCAVDHPAASVDAPLDRLLAVGHTSGAALAAGALHVLAVDPALEGAA